MLYSFVPLSTAAAMHPPTSGDHPTDPTTRPALAPLATSTCPRAHASPAARTRPAADQQLAPSHPSSPAPNQHMRAQPLHPAHWLSSHAQALSGSVPHIAQHSTTQHSTAQHWPLGTRMIQHAPQSFPPISASSAPQAPLGSGQPCTRSPLVSALWHADGPHGWPAQSPGRCAAVGACACGGVPRAIAHGTNWGRGRPGRDPRGGVAPAWGDGRGAGRGLGARAHPAASHSH